MLYQEALTFIYGLTNYEKNPMPANTDDALNLARMRALLAALGNPQDQFKSIHVTGTKGKGSTCAFLVSILRNMGLKVGLYSSPHLSSFRERMQVDGNLAAPENVGVLADKIKSALYETVKEKQASKDADGNDVETEVDVVKTKIAGVTFFEAATAMAFLHFAHEKVDWAVIEVGLGGRLDATNVIMPQASVITAISYDHQAVLGNTLAEIAREKAGIIKAGVPVVTQSQSLEAMQVIERVAHEKSCAVNIVGRHWRWTPGMGTTAINKQTFEAKQVSLIRSKNKPFVNDLEGFYEIQLNGKHQIDNALTALATVDLIREPLRASGVSEISAKVVRDGLRNASWAGRFEIVRGMPPLIFDGAHNVDSVNKLLMTLVELYPGKRWTFVFGCYKDKDAEGMLKQLSARANRFIFTQAESATRATPPEQLLELATQHKLKAISVPKLMDALEDATAGNDGVCVTGSLSVVGEARVKWAMKMGLPVPDVD